MDDRIGSPAAFAFRCGRVGRCTNWNRHLRHLGQLLTANPRGKPGVSLRKDAHQAPAATSSH